MDELSESPVKEFDYKGQHVVIYQAFGAGYSYATSAGAIGCNFKSQAEAEAAARKVIDDQASDWLQEALREE